ncbi:MAG TPA: Crp/Fnr family transcriptional regulator [Gemmatimonadaceae bacterium]
MLTALKRHSRLAGDTATTLASYGARTTWPSGFQIYQKGSAADGISLVVRGHVILRNRIRTGRSFVPAIVTPGEIFGVEGITHDAAYVTDAYAADETETLYIDGQRFRAFVRENPGAALEVISQLMSERSHLLEKLHAMASQNVEQRLVSALERLAADRSFLTADGRLRLELKHHRLLCEMVGATRESIALALGRLVGAGVATRRGMSFIIAPSKLADHITSESATADREVPLTQESLQH